MATAEPLSKIVTARVDEREYLRATKSHHWLSVIGVQTETDGPLMLIGRTFPTSYRCIGSDEFVVRQDSTRGS